MEADFNMWPVYLADNNVKKQSYGSTHCLNDTNRFDVSTLRNCLRILYHYHQTRGLLVCSHLPINEKYNFLYCWRSFQKYFLFILQLVCVFAAESNGVPLFKKFLKGNTCQSLWRCCEYDGIDIMLSICEKFYVNSKAYDFWSLDFSVIVFHAKPEDSLLLFRVIL
jgi:hypothetical protein